MPEPSDPGIDDDALAEADTAEEAAAALSDVDTLAELRDLLVGPERKELEELRERLAASGVEVEHVADLLPAAIALREQRDDHLARALATTVEGAIQTSVKNNPQPMIDAVFPVIGPAIRKAVSDALAKAVQSLNQTLEHSLSIRSLRWRIEAARTGKPFAEVLLLNTLRYRVEQVFLIDPDSGLLMQHAAAPGVESRDEQLVSGMFTAITDFVRDSFSTGEQAGLRTMQVGGVTVWVERGPQAVLAGAVRGSAPAELRETFQRALEDIHRQHGDQLENFGGDDTALGPARPLLERCLVSAAQPGAKRKVSPALIIFALVALGLLTWAAVGGVRSNARWGRLVERLEESPAVMLVEADHNWWGRSTLRGFYDPAATPTPQDLMAESGIDPEEFRTQWLAFPQAASAPQVSAAQAEEKPPVEADAVPTMSQARQLLAPPAGVTLRRSDPETLVLTGEADAVWIGSLRKKRLALTTIGILRVDESGLVNRTARNLEAALGRIEAAEIAVPVGSDFDADTDRETFDRLTADLALAQDSVAVFGQALTLRVTGHADTTGHPDVNQRLSEARAEAVAAAIRSEMGHPPAMVVEGVGSSRPLVSASSPREEQVRNRRVTFAVELRNIP